MRTARTRKMAADADALRRECALRRTLFCVIGRSFQSAVVERKRGDVRMTKREMYEARTEEFLLPLVDKHHFELVDVEFVKEGANWYLRAYIDKEGGIAVDDCEVISRILSDWLDKEDFIDDSYILEVSSPGLGRPLKKEKDFARSIGKEVDIRLYRPREKQKDFTGTLVEYNKDTVTIELEDESRETFERREIALIRLAFDF